MINKELKVAIVSDHMFSIGGAARVTKEIGELFSNVDYYFTFGDEKLCREYLNTQRVRFSFLQRFPLLKRYYRYTYFLWPLCIESFNLKGYDIVISNSYSVAHGCITDMESLHIAYINTPMRYAWDLKDVYFSRLGLLKRLVINLFLNYLRIWDVSAGNRPDILISNSKFVSKRIKKYWGIDTDDVIYPPVDLYSGDILKKRGDYFVVGAPFEANKYGEELIGWCVDLGINLKVIGVGGNYNRLRKKYYKNTNIEFLGRVSEEDKYIVMSNAKGYIASGIEDFGIFPVEAISCGTPVIAYSCGGYLESVIDGVNGVFFDNLCLESFKHSYEEFLSIKWDYCSISYTSKSFSRGEFIKKFEACILKNI